MQEESYFLNSKNSEKLPHCRKFIISYYEKNSTIYNILTFLENFCNRDKLSVLKQQLIYLQNKHGKGYLATFIEMKDTKHYYR